MKKYVKEIILSASLLFLIGCSQKKCSYNSNPYESTLGVILDSIYKESGIKKMKCVNNKGYSNLNVDFQKSIIKKIEGDSLFIANQIISKLSNLNPTVIAGVKTKRFKLTLNDEKDLDGLIEVSNYIYDESKNLGAYYFVLMMGKKRKGIDDYIVYFNYDKENCKWSFVSSKRLSHSI